MNNLFKTAGKIDLDENHYLESDGSWGVSLVQHFPAKRINKKGEETEYTATERYYYTTVAQALEKYVNLKQIILPEVSEMLEIQKETLVILKEFKERWKNWD
jgi:stalled ribosome rescue protein Dom34